MKVTAQRSLLAGALAAALLMAAPSPSSADPNGPPPDGAAPASSAAELLGGAIGNRGLISFRDVFAGVQIDVPGNRVVVWATDGARGRKLAAAGRKDLPEAATRGVNVDVRQSKHTRARLEAARAALWPRLDGAAVSISVPSDGSGLVVAATDPDRTRRLLKQGTPTLSEISADDVKVKIGQVMRATDRHNDAPPHKGGGPLRDFFALKWCTAAFGMKASSVTYLMTAEHCFAKGEQVYDGGLTPFDQIGSIRRTSKLYDAGAISGSASSKVWIDDDQTRTYKRANWSWNGQLVCQSGYTSNKICAIEVVNDNIEWTDNTGTRRRGVMGVVCGGCVAVRPGDSGGPVWAFASTTFESRGIVSAGGNPVGDGFELIAWTETPAVLNVLSGTLITG